MSERRQLIEGLKPPPPPIDPNLEKKFVYGDKLTKEPEPMFEKAAPPMARVPLTTRIRGD